MINKINWKIRVVVFCVAVFLLFNFIGLRTAETMYITNDAYVDYDFPDENFGENVELHAHLDYRETYIDLNTTDNLNLYIYCDYCDNDLYIYNTTYFDESTITWNNKPTALDLIKTDYVLSGWNIIPIYNHSQYVMLTTPDSEQYIIFSSSEGSHPPYVGTIYNLITSWQNNITNDSSLDILSGYLRTINFNVTTNAPSYFQESIYNINNSEWVMYHNLLSLENSTEASWNFTPTDYGYYHYNMIIEACTEKEFYNNEVWRCVPSSIFDDKMWVVRFHPFPVITSWNNSKTQNSNLSINVTPIENINFNVIADQVIQTWTWKANGNELDNNYDNITLNFTATNHTLSINATNENGTTNTISWNIISVNISPLPPKNINSLTGNFWINTSWEKNESTNINVDSYNVSVNGTWINGSSLAYVNNSLYPHAFNNVTVWSYNSSYGYGLSVSSISLSTQIPNNPVVLSNISSSYNLLEGQSLFIYPNSSDIDNDTPFYSTNATKGSINSTAGFYNWTTHLGDLGTYIWNITVNDGYSSISTITFKVTVIPNYPPSIPVLNPTVFYEDTNYSGYVSWYPSTDLENDSIHYHYKVISSSDGVNVLNTTTTDLLSSNFTLGSINQYYYGARACDPYSCSNWSAERIIYSNFYQDSSYAYPWKQFGNYPNGTFSTENGNATANKKWSNGSSLGNNIVIGSDGTILAVTGAEHVCIAKNGSIISTVSAADIDSFNLVLDSLERPISLSGTPSYLVFRRYSSLCSGSSDPYVFLPGGTISGITIANDYLYLIHNSTKVVKTKPGTAAMTVYWSTAITDPYASLGRPIVDLINNRVYVTVRWFDDSINKHISKLYALNLGTGGVEWTYQDPTADKIMWYGSTNSNVVLDSNGNVYYSGGNSALRSINTAGVLRWKKYLSFDHAAISLKNDRIYAYYRGIGPDVEKFISVDTSNGEPVWHYYLSIDASRLLRNPIVDKDETSYFIDDYAYPKIIAFYKNGTIKFKFTPNVRCGGTYEHYYGYQLTMYGNNLFMTGGGAINAFGGNPIWFTKNITTNYTAYIGELCSYIPYWTPEVPPLPCNFDPSGYIKDTVGNPLFNAKVTLSNATFNVTDYSDANGYWNVDIYADGNYDYNVSLKGYTKKTGTQTFVMGGTDYNYSLTPESARIYGTVYEWTNGTGSKSIVGDLKSIKQIFKKLKKYKIGLGGTLTLPVAPDTKVYVVKLKDIDISGDTAIIQIYEAGSVIKEDIVEENKNYQYKVSETDTTELYLTLQIHDIFSGKEIAWMDVTPGFDVKQKSVVSFWDIVYKWMWYFETGLTGVIHFFVDIVNWIDFSVDKPDTMVTYNASSESDAEAQTVMDFSEDTSLTTYFLTIRTKNNGEPGKIGYGFTDDDIETPPNYKTINIQTGENQYLSDYRNFSDTDTNANKKIKVWLYFYSGYGTKWDFNYFVTAFCIGCNLIPLPDATIYQSYTNNTKSDATGLYNLFVPFGTYNISYSKDGYESKTYQITFNSTNNIVKKDVVINKSDIIINPFIHYINVLPDPSTYGTSLKAYYKTLSTYSSYRIVICPFNDEANCFNIYDAGDGVKPNTESFVSLGIYGIGTYSAYLSGKDFFDWSWKIVASDNFTIISDIPVAQWEASTYYLGDTMKVNIYVPSGSQTVTAFYPNSSVLYTGVFSAATTVQNLTFPTTIMLATNTTPAVYMPAGKYTVRITGNNNQSITELLPIIATNYSLSAPSSVVWGKSFTVQYLSPKTSELVITKSDGSPAYPVKTVLGQKSITFNTSSLENKDDTLTIQLIQTGGVIKASTTIKILVGAKTVDETTKDITNLLGSNMFWAFVVTVGMMITVGIRTRRDDGLNALPIAMTGLLGLASFTLIGWIPYWLLFSIILLIIIIFGWQQADKTKTGGG